MVNPSVDFVDEVELSVRAGSGGNGCIAFRREKFVAFGGPAGGDGGRGGDVIFVADSGLGTLMDLRYRKEIRAQHGQNGRGKDQYGKAGETIRVRVPVGTQIIDREREVLLADLTQHGEEVVIAKGGRGGRGNIHFATPTDRAPRRAEDGQPGEQYQLRLELKLLADVGVIGFPNVGKSTFIAAVSRARPKIANYPFTTLTPNLGVVSLGVDRSFVIADIPGIIEGAAEGAGLGIRFLKHVQRSKVLLHVVAPDPDPSRDPVQDYNTLCEELARFDEELASRPTVVALSKTDLPEAEPALAKLRDALNPRGIEVHAFSSATREGLDALLLELERIVAVKPE